MSRLNKLPVCAGLAFLLSPHSNNHSLTGFMSARADNSAVTDAIRAALRTGSTVFPPKYERNLKTGIGTHAGKVAFRSVAQGTTVGPLGHFHVAPSQSDSLLAAGGEP